MCGRKTITDLEQKAQTSSNYRVTLHPDLLLHLWREREKFLHLVSLRSKRLTSQLVRKPSHNHTSHRSSYSSKTWRFWYLRGSGQREVKPQEHPGFSYPWLYNEWAHPICLKTAPTCGSWLVGWQNQSRECTAPFPMSLLLNISLLLPTDGTRMQLLWCTPLPN